MYLALNAAFSPSALTNGLSPPKSVFPTVSAGQIKDTASPYTPFPKRRPGTADLSWKRLEDALLRSFSDLFCTML